MHPDYQATLASLYRREAMAGIDLKLWRVERVARALGSPHRRFRVIHVAGTNGKGSTASAAAAVLENAGYRVGLYTSPHLVSFRERVRIEGELISEEEVVSGVAEVDDAAGLVLAEESSLTFFETATLLGFLSFARHGVDIAIVEVGLGGRLDATNIVDAEVAVIAPVARDHEKFLGHDLGAIAAEKAAIMKPRKPVVTGRQEAPAMAVIRSVAEAGGNLLFEANRHFMVEGHGQGRFTFCGCKRVIKDLWISHEAPIQRENATLALAALEAIEGTVEVTEPAIRQGLASWKWPGRFQVIPGPPEVILDGAHNPAATRALVEQICAGAGASRRLLLFGAMKDKRWREMLEILRPHVDAIVLTRADGERGEDPALISRVLREDGWNDPRLTVDSDPDSALDRLLFEAGRERAVVVTGSLFLVGQILPRFDERLSSLKRVEERAGRSLPVG